MEEKYIWDLSHIYKTKDDVEKAIEEANSLLEKIKVRMELLLLILI